MRIFRLLPDDEGAWGRFEDFQSRIRGFVENYTPETNAMALIKEVRERWIGTPHLTGYWIVYGDAGIPIVHNLSWVAERHGQPYINFYQTEMDDPAHCVEILEKVGLQIRQWIAALNQISEAKGDPRRITYGESQTWIKGAVYERLFKHVGFDLKAMHQVYRWNVREN